MVLLQSEIKELQKGDAAPDFSLKNVYEDTVSLSDFKGKPIVVIFMCNHCPYVKPKMSEIAAIQNDYKDFAVICINSNDPIEYPEDDFEHMKKIAEKFGYNYYLVDETQDVARAYGAACTPDPFVFDAGHKLVFHGRINDAMNPSDEASESTLRNILDKVREEEEIEEWFVPSMGCSIKWKE